MVTLPQAASSQAASSLAASSQIAASQVASPQVASLQAASPWVASPQISLPLVASSVGPGAPQASVGVLDSLRSAFLQAPQNPGVRRLMDELLVSRFVAAEPSSYDILRDRYEEATRYWRLHRLATIIHPRFVNHLT